MSDTEEAPPGLAQPPEAGSFAAFQECIENNAEAISALSLALQGLRPQVPDAAATRISKMERLYGFFIKHNKLKDFKPGESTDIYEWLKQFDASIETIASAGCGLDLAAAPLTDPEFIRLIKIKISYQVESEILQDLQTVNKTWADATQIEVRTAMMNLYRKREPPICGILKMFAPDRVKKNDLPVAAYHAKWKDSLSPSVICHTVADKVAFYDLVHRGSFFYGLNDPYIQKEISSIKEPDQSLQ